MAALALSGCSALFMEKVPDKWTPATEPRCTETGGWIAWDVLIALGDGIAIPIALSGKTHEEFPDSYEASGAQRNSNQSRNLIAIAAGVGAAAHLLSAVHGNNAQDRCIEARKRRDVFVAGHRPRPAAPAKTREQLELEQLKARVRELEQPAAAIEPAPAPSPAAETEPAPPISGAE
jgi:hypothetical protein